MTPTSVVELSDVSGRPKVKLALPVPLLVGHRLTLKFRLAREHGGRHEQLDVVGEFKVKTVSFDASTGIGRQILSVEAMEKPPSWRAVKKQPVPARRLGPTRFARIIVA